MNTPHTLLTLIIALTMLTACTMPSMKIRPMGLKLPEGDDSYSTGFRNGCDSALSIVSAGLISSTTNFELDPNRGIEDREYYEGYQMGSNYCTYFTDPGPI